MSSLPPPGSRVAQYARYSTELQQFSSIEGQFRSMDAYQERQGWVLAKRYHDAAQSGTTTIGRKGLLSMLLDAEEGLFDVVLLEDLDRISRDAADMHQIAKDLDELGIVLCTVASGVVTDIEMAFKAVQSQQFIKMNVQKSKRGQELAIANGRLSGSVAYGYFKVHKLDHRNEPINGLREIKPSEAVIVICIFSDFAAGKTTFQICKELNQEGVPGPKGKPWRPGTLLGNAQGSQGVLRNTLYPGEMHFRKTERKVRRGQVKMRFRARGERIIVDHPELAIVSRELWDAVQARLAANWDKPFHSKKRMVYLFSGRVFCGECESFCTVTDGMYVCTGHSQKGICTKTRRVFRESLEITVVERIRLHLLSSGLLEPSLEAYREEVLRANAESKARNSIVTEQLNEVAQRIRNLTDRLAGAAGSPLAGQIHSRLQLRA